MLFRQFVSLVSVFTFLLISGALAQSGQGRSDLRFAPPNFPFLQSKAVFIDFEWVRSEMKIDMSARKALITTTVQFNQPEDGHILFDLVPEVDTFSMDGGGKSTRVIMLISDPDKVTRYRVNLLKTTKGTHTMEITHTMKPSSNFKIGTTFIDFMTRMSDLSIRGNIHGRGFIERYFPSNMEWDQYQNIITVLIEGSKIEHTVKTNGEFKKLGRNHFEIDFSTGIFGSSEFFIHIMNPEAYFFKPLKILNGEENQIPVEIYSRSKKEADIAYNKIAGIFVEIENNFGSFLFPKFIAHLTVNGGGMEYGGATDASNWALSHEVFHSWFARGVKPADGNSGWIDEGLARWRDGDRAGNRYPRAKSAKIQGRRAQLSGFSPYRRHTSINSYEIGSFMFSKIDRAIADEGKSGGLRPILKKFVQEYAYQTITTQIFFDYLQERVETDLKPYFDYYVFKKGPIILIDGPRKRLH